MIQAIMAAMLRLWATSSPPAAGEGRSPFRRPETFRKKSQLSLALQTETPSVSQSRYTGMSRTTVGIPQAKASRTTMPSVSS